MFGWIPPLWKIRDEQVLAAAGLDAYVVSESLDVTQARQPRTKLAPVPHILQNGN